MEVAIIIFAIIQVIILIVFCVMASNVSKIKKYLTIGDDHPGLRYRKMAREERYIGNKEKAKEYLMRARYQYEDMNESYYDTDSGEYLSGSAGVTQVDKLISEL